MPSPSNPNGGRPPIPFPPAGDLPIVGAPYKLHCVIPTVMATCSCEAGGPVLLIGLGAQASCPACRKVFILREFSGSAATGQMTAVIETGTPREAPPA